MDDNRIFGTTEKEICYLTDSCAVYDYGMCFVPLRESEGIGIEPHIRLSVGSSGISSVSDLVRTLVS